MAVVLGIEIAIAPPVVALEEDDMGYIISFDSQGGSFVPARGVIVGSAIGELPVPPTRVGFSLVGWYTTPISGGSQITAQTVPSADMTAYARWASSPVPTGACRAVADDGAAETVPEGAAKVVRVLFIDSAGAAFAPDSLSWSLYDSRGLAVNSKEDVPLTPGSAVDVVVPGTDNSAGTDGEARRLVVRAKYTSTAGAGLDIVLEVKYPVAEVAGA